MGTVFRHFQALGMNTLIITPRFSRSSQAHLLVGLITEMHKYHTTIRRNTILTYSFIHLRDKENFYLLVHSSNAHKRQKWERLTPRSWEFHPGLPRGWQGLSHRNQHLPLPRVLTSRKLESGIEPGPKPRHTDEGGGQPKQCLHCHTQGPLHHELLRDYPPLFFFGTKSQLIF